MANVLWRKDFFLTFCLVVQCSCYRNCFAIRYHCAFMDQSSPEISTEKMNTFSKIKIAISPCAIAVYSAIEMAPNGSPYHLSCAKFPEMHSPEVRPSIPSRLTYCISTQTQRHKSRSFENSFSLLHSCANYYHYPISCSA